MDMTSAAMTMVSRWCCMQKHILLEIISRHLIDYCGHVGILFEKQSCFRRNRSTTHMMFMIPPLKELARKDRIPLYTRFIDISKVYNPKCSCGKCSPGLMVARARCRFQWNRVYAKGAYSHPSCIIKLLAGFYTWGLHAFRGGQVYHRRFDGARGSNDHYGACHTLRMPESSHYCLGS